MTTKIEPHINVRRVCDLLDCHRNTVYSLVRRGQLRAIRLSARDMRISVPSVEEFLERRRVEAGSGGELRGEELRS